MILWFNDNGNCLFALFLIPSLFSYWLFLRDDEVPRIGFKKSIHLPKSERIDIKILIVRLSHSMTLIFANQFNLKFMIDFALLVHLSIRQTYTHTHTHTHTHTQQLGQNVISVDLVRLRRRRRINKHRHWTKPYLLLLGNKSFSTTNDYYVRKEKNNVYKEREREREKKLTRSLFLFLLLSVRANRNDTYLVLPLCLFSSDWRTSPGFLWSRNDESKYWKESTTSQEESK